MKNLYKKIPQELKILGWTFVIFFLVASVFSHNAINAAVWGLLGAYLWTGIFLNDVAIRTFIGVNLYGSLLIIILSAINMQQELITMPEFLSNTNVLSIGIIILIMSVIGMLIMPIAEIAHASKKAEEYLRDFNS